MKSEKIIMFGFVLDKPYINIAGKTECFMSFINYTDLFLLSIRPIGSFQNNTRYICFSVLFRVRFKCLDLRITTLLSSPSHADYI